MEVLRKEEEHRQMHRRRECHCEVIFDAEERERRLRPRGSKGKGKGRELAPIEFGGQGGGEGSAGVAGVSRVAGKGLRIDTTVAGSGNPIVEVGPTNTRQGDADAQVVYQNAGYHTGGAGIPQQRQGGGFPAGGNTQMDLVPMEQQPGYPVGVGGGYGRTDLDHVARGEGFPVGGVIPREYLWEGQMEIGQAGTGMKWYPQQNEPNMPAMPDFYQSSTSIFDRMPRTWRSKSEPPEEINHPASPAVAFTKPAAVAVAVDVQTEPQQPAIVSSDMADTKL